MASGKAQKKENVLLLYRKSISDKVTSEQRSRGRDGEKGSKQREKQM